VLVQNLDDGFLEFLEWINVRALGEESFLATFWNAEDAGHQDGAILMTSVFGVPKSCEKAFFAQGAYVYPFEELQEAIIEVLDKHFAHEEKDLRGALNSLLSSSKPKLILVKR